MNWWNLSILLLGGLGIFLHGMNVMTEGLKAAAGSRMKSFLRKMTKNRWTSLLAGTGITAIIQSSSVTTVLAVGFVSAGLLSFQNTLGLILGANLGTTITAQIIAFKVTKASWAMIAIGYLISIVFEKRPIKHFGTILLGLGMVFLGMSVMSEATSPLKNYPPFIDLMKGLDNYLWGILIGTLFTAAVQSSSATTGVVIVMASQNLISVEAGIAIIFGANIGTCITAVLSAIGKPRDAMRVALSHIFFKVAGVMLWYPFIDQLAAFVEILSGHNEARQIANAHTIFNVCNSFLFIWFVNPLAKVILWILPPKKQEDKKQFPELHFYYLEDPSIALDLAGRTIAKLGDQTTNILGKGLNVALKGSATDLSVLRKEDENVDLGHAEILLFLQQLQSVAISKKEVKRLEKQVEVVNILETAADLITTNLVEAAEHRINEEFQIGEESLHKMTGLYELAIADFSAMLNKFTGSEPAGAPSISKREFKDQYHKVRTHLIHRLSETDEKRISIFRFETEVLETIRSLHALARRLKRKAE